MKLHSVFKFKPYLSAIALLQFLMVIVKSSPVLFERDILIEQNAKPMEDEPRTKRAAAWNIWNFGVIPYIIDENVGYSEDEKAEFKKAMQNWEKFTCIKFVERKPLEDDYYIRFTKTQDCECCSVVGKNWYNRYRGQDVSIGDGCHSKGIILHELGHAIGFNHEHMRPDRDDYVEILPYFDDDKNNFKKLTADDVDSLGEAYDYNSIMHYSDRFMLPKNRDKNGELPRIGQRDELSPGDIRQTNKLYKCPECGRTFHDQSATFTSPNYYTKSGKEFQCEWRISVAEGKQIRLDIIYLDIFESIDCQSNYLEIRDGYWHKSPLLGRFCGVKNNIPAMLSTGNRITINYFSTKPEHRGFSADYTSHTSICGGDIDIYNEKEIESPNYPQSYPSNVECIWRITNPHKNQVGIHFHSFDLELHSNCRYDFVEVRDGDSPTSPLIGSYCGSSLNQRILRSTSNKMYIRFVSDVSSEGRGFSASGIVYNP